MPRNADLIKRLLIKLIWYYFVKRLAFRCVLVDAWYASMRVMKAIEALSKVYYAPLKCNRLVNDTQGVDPYKRVDALEWRQSEMREGKLVHIKKFPKGHEVKLFRLVSPPDARNILRPTTYLNLMRMRRNKRVACGGRLNNFIVS